MGRNSPMGDRSLPRTSRSSPRSTGASLPQGTGTRIRSSLVLAGSLARPATMRACWPIRLRSSSTSTAPCSTKSSRSSGGWSQRIEQTGEPSERPSRTTVEIVRSGHITSRVESRTRERWEAEMAYYDLGAFGRPVTTQHSEAQLWFRPRDGVVLRLQPRRGHRLLRAGARARPRPRHGPLGHRLRHRPQLQQALGSLRRRRQAPLARARPGRLGRGRRRG